MDDRGWTIIELVLVIIVIAIIAAVAVPQFSRYYGGIKLGNAAMKIASDIRYAQNRATTTQQRSRVNFTSAAAYDVQYCNGVYSAAACSCTQWLSAAGFPVNLTNTEFSGVTITAPAPGSWLQFDSLGRPYYNTANCNPTDTAGTTITFSGSTKTITVATQTGMVSY